MSEIVERVGFRKTIADFSTIVSPAPAPESFLSDALWVGSRFSVKISGFLYHDWQLTLPAGPAARRFLSRRLQMNR